MTKAKISQLANPPKITYSENGSYRKEAAAFEIDTNEPKFVLIKKINNDSKNISRTFSGVVVGSVGSVHFQIVPWSSFYFSRSIGPFLCSRY